MDYNELLEQLQKLNKNYQIKVIGKTKFNRKIFAVERILDKSFSTAFLVAGIHARENISCDLLFEMIEKGLFDEIKEFNLSFIIMANPDGVALQSGGLFEFSKSEQKKLVKMNNGSTDFTMWKANVRGVDLNNNFNANFNMNVHSHFPASHGYIGKHAFSEKETRALKRYTMKLKPFITISYHTKGEEIYFNFFQSGARLVRDGKIAERFAKSTGYIIKNVENSSSGGYKDWCVLKLKIPSLTIELGSDNLVHPIGKDNLKEIFEKNKTIASDLKFAYNEFINSKREVYGIQ